ncbi:MAG: hypothetical protein PVH74_05485, partial [Desulfobacterales bacterium]
RGRIPLALARMESCTLQHRVFMKAQRPKGHMAFTVLHLQNSALVMPSRTFYLLPSKSGYWSLATGSWLLGADSSNGVGVPQSE